MHHTTESSTSRAYANDAPVRCEYGGCELCLGLHAPFSHRKEIEKHKINFKTIYCIWFSLLLWPFSAGYYTIQPNFGHLQRRSNSRWCALRSMLIKGDTYRDSNNDVR